MALPVKIGSKLSAAAEEFVPALVVEHKPVVHKSAQYRGDKSEYFEDIKAQLLAFRWRADVKAIYVTNGWHTEYKGFGAVAAEVWLCDYRLNDDSAAINHWYPGYDNPPGTC